MQPNKQVAPKTNKQQSIKGKQARIWQWPRSKQTISTYSAYRNIDNMWPRFFIFPLQGSSYVFPSCDTKQWEWVLGRKCGGHEVNWRKKEESEVITSSIGKMTKCQEKCLKKFKKKKEKFDKFMDNMEPVLKDYYLKYNSKSKLEFNVRRS